MDIVETETAEADEAIAKLGPNATISASRHRNRMILPCMNVMLGSSL